MKKKDGKTSSKENKNIENFISFEDDMIERLKDINFARVYLNVCLSTKYKGAKQDFFAALGHVVKGLGISKIASKKTLYRSTIYKSFKEDSNPSFRTVLHLLDALGLEIKFVTKKKRKQLRSSKLK